MSGISRPVVIAALVALAAAAVVRNVIFFGGYGSDRVRPASSTDGSLAAVVVPKVGSGVAIQGGAGGPPSATPPERRLAALLRSAPVVPADAASARDPFHLPPPPPPARPQEIATPPKPGTPELRILLTSEKRQVAMVDGHIVAPGDRVRGRRVAEITAEGLRLVGRGGETRIELPLLPTDLADDEQR